MLDKNKKKAEEEELPQEPAKEEPQKVLLYSMIKWKGIVDVYQCSQCDFSDESEDTMKLHVLTHFPKEQQNSVLDKLVYMEGKG